MASSGLKWLILSPKRALDYDTQRVASVSVRLRFGGGTVRAVRVFGSSGSSGEERLFFLCFSTETKMLGREICRVDLWWIFRIQIISRIFPKQILSTPTRVHLVSQNFWTTK